MTFTILLGLGALLSWLGGQARLVLSLAARLAVFLRAAFLASLIAAALAKMLRWNIYDRAPLHFSHNLLASGSLTVAWVVHAVRLVDGAALQASWWQGGLPFFVGLLATVVAVQMIQEVLPARDHQLANAALGLVGYAAWGRGWRSPDRCRSASWHFETPTWLSDHSRTRQRRGKGGIHQSRPLQNPVEDLLR